MSEVIRDVEQRLFLTDEQKQEWFATLVFVQISNPWTDWEREPDPAALLLQMVEEDLGIVPSATDYDEVYRLAFDIATYQGIDDETEEDDDYEGDR